MLKDDKVHKGKVQMKQNLYKYLFASPQLREFVDLLFVCSGLPLTNQCQIDQRDRKPSEGIESPERKITF